MSHNKPHTKYSIREEVAHAVTHGIGTCLSLAGLVLLSVKAARYGSSWHLVAGCVYASTLVLMYASSTLYHALTGARTKRVFQILDHAAIYLLIAGTYTPFTLITLRGPWGWTLFGLVWGLAVGGTLFEIFLQGRFKKLSLLLYLCLGWLAVVAIKPLLTSLPTGGLLLLLAGGLAYSGGAAFYSWRSLRYHHAIWHAFVLLGSLSHFFCILLYVMPSGD